MNQNKLRLPSATTWAALSTLALASLAHAQTGPDLLLGSFDEGRNFKLSGGAVVTAEGETDNNNADVQLGVYSVQGMMKLDFDAFAKSWNLNRAQPRAGVEYIHLDINSNDPALPEHFSDTSIGLGMGIGKGEKWVAGISFALGHASENALGDGNGWYGKADIAVGYTFNDDESIGFILDYDGNRTFLPDVPLPGFVYKRRLNDQTKISVGFPFTDLEYKPDDNWTIVLRYVIPDSGEASIEYKATEQVRLYASLSSQSEAFHWDQLSDSSDRVLFHQTRAELGLRGTYNDQFSFFLAGGYAFSQRFEVGWDSREADEIAELSDEPYARVGFELNF